MKKELLFILITILGFNSYAQISFEEAYFINNSEQKVDCLIKNIDWESNPFEFEYKLTEHSDIIKATIKTVKEFGIYSTSKYSRQKVKIDRSSHEIGKLSDVKEPVFKEEELFLKVLVEGKANLYLFKKANLYRYFYSKEDSEIKQLIFKKYLNEDNSIATNIRYKQQLWNDLKCTNFTISKVENVNYRKNELIRFFVEYNSCTNQEFINYEAKEKKDLFNLSIRPGLNSSSLSIQNAFSNTTDTDFDNELGFRVGVEAEFILPFNKNKWAILIEPTYQYFKSEKELTTPNPNENVKADYKSIELPLGVRHYFFLNASSKIFVNGLYVIDFSSNSNIHFDRRADLEIKKTRKNFAFGLGYKSNNRYSLELRYQTSRDILGGYYLSWNSDYNTFSVIFGYSIF